MSNIDLIIMSFRNLFKRKVRTFLTVLGVVVGTCAIIIMLSIGFAINLSFEERVANMGNVRIMSIYNRGGGGGMMNGGGYAVSIGGSMGGASGKALALDDKAIAAIKKIPHVEAATPTMEMYVYASAASGKYVGEIQIKGIDPNVMDAFEYKISEGEFFSSDDKYGVVFGAEALSYFRKPNDRNWWRSMDSGTSPVDIFKDKIEISYDYNFIYNQDNPFGESNEPEYQKPKPIKISPKGTLQVMDWDTDRYGFMSIADVQKMKADQARFEQARNQAYGGYSGGQKKVSLSEYDKAMVKVDDIKNVEQVKEEIEKMGFYADSYFIDMLSEMNDLGSSLQMFLGIIGAVSLFVAAIGIANTMIMSIYERTREIGVMKVIGASIKDIKRLFLLESSIIGLIGGILGLLLSFLISYMLNKNGLAFLSGITGNLQGIGQKVSVIPPWLSPAALLFASMIGLVSGYLPAKRAMNLSALAALRTE